MDMLWWIYCGGVGGCVCRVLWWDGGYIDVEIGLLHVPPCCCIDGSLDCLFFNSCKVERDREY